MSHLKDYAERFETLRFERRDGVLLVTLHKDGGPAEWGISEQGLHNELGLAFAEVARDPENRVVIITGAGDEFCARFDFKTPYPDTRTPAGWDRIVREGKSLIGNLLDIPVPVIGAVNGPALIHAEVALLSDVVLAAEHAEFADLAHVPGNSPPGDGVQVIWPMLLGPNRGRYFLMTGQRIGAAEALRLGVVGEVLPKEKLLERAWEIGFGLAEKPPLMLRYTRQLLTQHLKKRMLDELVPGLIIEGMALVREG
jgi:enoyl-CoA hydratase/carnithine racemase